MSLSEAAAPEPSASSEEPHFSVAHSPAALMSQNGDGREKSQPAVGTTHVDAREVVRLIQCALCSRPFRTPVTLPCGNSLCKECLPEPHEREGIVSYPEPGPRRHAITCPFDSCGQEHPTLEIGVVIALTKFMESVAEVVARHRSVLTNETIIVEEVVQEDDMSTDSEKLRTHEMPGSRLIATYLLAAQGKLGHKSGLNCLEGSLQDDSNQTTDHAVLQDLIASAQKELDCQVCYNLMLDPVTTFCGHTLCRRCMNRVLDHTVHCPICRRMMAISSSPANQKSNMAIVNLLDGLCPEIVAARAEAIATEEFGGQGGLSVPLFICTLGFPNQPTFLCIFEPRYRLMLRRCLESNRQFGMLMPNQYREPQGDLGHVNFYHYGTMLEILSHYPRIDGSSIIETRGLYRFRVKAHGVRDGYTVGDVERIDDVSLVEEERIEAEETSGPPVDPSDVRGQIERMPTSELLTFGLAFITRMQRRSTSWLQERVLVAHGQPPENAAEFPFWFASVVPLRDTEKYQLLGTRTVRERLKITAVWIHRIESQRW